MIDYVLGLDIGIGSIGWAVINLNERRIEAANVRIFETGEDVKAKKSECQNRRDNRSKRRLVRRRSHRKMRLKKHLELIGLTAENDIKAYFEKENTNIISLRVKALDEKIAPEEIAACLIHICNHRGYRDFYSIGSFDKELLTKEEIKEIESDNEAINRVEQIMHEGKYRTPAEMIMKDHAFDGCSEYRKYRNSPFAEYTYLISRDMLEKEVCQILDKQREFYHCIDDNSIAKVVNIIFSQRDFEDGPGDVNDQFRKYKGFLDTLGKCRFYTEEKRGARFTAIADVYALVNTLSQYKYFSEDGIFCFNNEIANELVLYAIENGSLTKKDLKQIAKKFNITINDSGTDTTPLTKCFCYIKSVKPVFESFGYDWRELTADYTDVENNLLNRIGIVLSQYITPRRRIDELKKLSLDEKLVEKLSKMKFSGTSNVSYKYMVDSINAFLNGDIYGKYQMNFIKEIPVRTENEKPEKLPPFRNEDDCEFFNNPVVFRAINETRKLINAIISKYGYPCAVNIETADEVNRSFAERDADSKRNKSNEKENDRIRKEIAEMLAVDVNAIRPVQIERYKLWETQDHKCLYSGEEINPVAMLNDNGHLFEIDHIVPFSLILDNTLQNKALVYASENQKKGQRTPLMYMTEEQATGYKARVSVMLKSGKCSKKKYQYLMLENLFNEKLLNDWKSRNLNDTRYISKYIVNYLTENLRFNPKKDFADGFSIKDNNRVFAVKSKFTSQFRKQWLNPQTWGRKDKDELKKITYLDHAADAIVIANCRPEYVIIAGEKMKLYNIWKNAGKHITDEYTKSFDNCVESLVRYYGMNRNFVIKALKNPNYKITPIIPYIADETDNRLRDFNTHRILFDAMNDTDEQIIETFKSHNKHLYGNDPKFAESLKMPVISYKPERKYTGSITTENPISIKIIDGQEMQLTRIKITKLKAKQLKDIRTEDSDLIDSLKAVFADKGDEYDIDKYLKDNNLSCFTTLKGRRINKVTLMSEAPKIHYEKRISDNNYTIMDNRSYYCLEIYKTKDSKNNMQGIAMSDLVKKNGKLYLKPDYKYPDDYAEHIMYLFKGDYLHITDENGNLKFEGYYMSSYNVNENRICVIDDNCAYRIQKDKLRGKYTGISAKDKCIKLNVSILGEISGYNNGEGISCGEPLSLLNEKNLQ